MALKKRSNNLWQLLISMWQLLLFKDFDLMLCLVSTTKSFLKFSQTVGLLDSLSTLSVLDIYIPLILHKTYLGMKQCDTILRTFVRLVGFWSYTRSFILCLCIFHIGSWSRLLNWIFDDNNKSPFILFQNDYAIIFRQLFYYFLIFMWNLDRTGINYGQVLKNSDFTLWICSPGKRDMFFHKFC